MSAAALDAALGWLEVAAMAIERAGECAAAGHAEADERYSKSLAALVAQYREDRAWLRIERAIKAKLREERGGAGKGEKGRAA